MFMDHQFHILATAGSVILSLYIAYVTYLGYRNTHDTLLRNLTLSFIGFAICYAPHSAFTILADHNMKLFLIYGPVSRVAMTGFMLLGIWNYRFKQEVTEVPVPRSYWLKMIGLLMVGDALVFFIVQYELLPTALVQYTLEGGSLLMAILGVAIIYKRGWHRSHIMKVFSLALIYTAQGSATFILASPWNHLWWYAHIITALGFLLLSYIVVRAYHAAGDLSLVYSLDELVVALRDSKQELNKVNIDLRDTGNNLAEVNSQLNYANSQLEILAMQDELTSANNRRGFMLAAKRESTRAQRNEASYAMLMLDIDHFKLVNDKYGHDSGDLVLQCFARIVQKCIRPTDIFGRLGGEEFLVMLPDTTMDTALSIAERIRRSVAGEKLHIGNSKVGITVSIGVCQGLKEQIEEVIQKADHALYQAKQQGRDRIVMWYEEIGTMAY